MLQHLISCNRVWNKAGHVKFRGQKQVLFLEALLCNPTCQLDRSFPPWHDDNLQLQYWHNSLFAVNNVDFSVLQPWHWLHNSNSNSNRSPTMPKKWQESLLASSNMGYSKRQRSSWYCLEQIRCARIATWTRGSLHGLSRSIRYPWQLRLKISASLHGKHCLMVTRLYKNVSESYSSHFWLNNMKKGW